MCSDIQLHESSQQRQNVEHEVANGHTIPNEGERRCLMMTIGGNDSEKDHVSGGKPLLSITRVADAGFECHLNSKGGCLLDVHTGERVPINRFGNSYTMRAWIKDDKRQTGLGRQGAR